MTSIANPTQSRTPGRPIAIPSQPQGRTPQLHRTRSGRGVWGTTQLVLTEIAVILVALAALTESPALLGACGAAALGVLALGWGRSDGRWWYEATAAHSALRRRKNAAKVSFRSEDPSGAIEIHNYDDRGHHMGIGHDGEGWFAVVAVGGDDDLISGEHQTVELDRLGRVLEESSSGPSSIQVVNLRVSAPTSLVPARSPCAASYRELHMTLSHNSRCLAASLTWIAVRLDRDDAVEAAAERGGGPDGVAKALAATIGRVTKALGSAGITHRILDAESIRGALQTSCGFDPTTTPDPDAQVVERWRGWTSKGLAQLSFEVRRWPAQTAASCLDLLRAAPAERLVVSLTLRGGTNQHRVSTVVRVMAPPSEIDQTCHEVKVHASNMGVRLRPLHGLHEPAIFASAPTGGRPL